MSDDTIKSQLPSENIISRGIYHGSREVNAGVHSLIFPNHLDVKSSGTQEVS